MGQVAIGKVIDKAAELVEAGGAIGGFRTEEKARPVKRLTVFCEQLFSLGVTHGYPPEPTSTPVNSSSTTFAELTTPGKPAPGCVPAPTK